MKSVREKETAREAAKTILHGKNVGFIGGGNMAKAIAKGLLGNGTWLHLIYKLFHVL